MAQLLRVQCFNVSRDGFGTGEGQSLERPFGHADPTPLFSWRWPPPPASCIAPSRAALVAWTTT